MLLILQKSQWLDTFLNFTFWCEKIKIIQFPPFMETWIALWGSQTSKTSQLWKNRLVLAWEKPLWAQQALEKNYDANAPDSSWSGRWEPACDRKEVYLRVKQQFIKGEASFCTNKTIFWFYEKKKRVVFSVSFLFLFQIISRCEKLKFYSSPFFY